MTNPTFIQKALAFALITAATSASLEAGPRFAQGEVFFSATAQVTQTDSVSPRADSISDTIYTITPTVYYTRDTANLNLNAVLSFPVNRYEKSDELDSDSTSFSLSGNIPYGSGPRLSGNWSVSYFDGVRTDYFSNRNVSSETFQANILSEYRMVGNLALRASASQNDRASTGIGVVSQNDNKTTAYSLGLHARDFIGRIGAYVEYRIQKRVTEAGRIGQGVDDKDSGLNFGVTGQILPERLFPKLETDLSFGFNSSSVSDSNTVGESGGEKRLTVNGSLRYAANTKTNVALVLNRGLRVTDDDRTIENTSVNLNVQYNPRPKLGLNASIGVQSNDFIFDAESRNDDVTNLILGAVYSIRNNWTASVNYDFRNTSSNEAIADYSSSRVSLSTTIRY